MDPLSDILSLLKPRSYITAGFDAGGDRSLRLDDLAGRIKCYAVIRGRCWLALEGHGASVALMQGDCFVLPSGSPVRIASDLALEPTLASSALKPDRHSETVTYNGGGDVLLVGSRFEVNGHPAEALLQTLPPIIHLRAAGDQAVLRWPIELMMQELRDERPGASLMTQHLAHTMLVQTLRLYLSQQAGSGIGLFAALGDPQIGRALGAIHADPTQDWTLEDLAAEAGMSRSVFARRFRERVGEPPMAYVTRWRMMRAAERLVTSREPLSRIATSVGYGSENAFNTAFRRVMGVAPRRYARGAGVHDI
ncbi:AraC family transcriptional regulator [Teichococcus vastitatis]|uniref:AraC family transcriptional regulator n=1 Tax=Teichococcus vastitatis TaxID=2307076 RepID=A0ABS9W8G5_9PROT|nr:AraC family transcriptional regulator [Pseudoroseomonas vastitatis]MCI0755522.1 AraC family transcriptional regulator [Pseudoroseomonas vastitatis]